jgi:ATP-dependent DNA helicase RecG
MIRGSLFEAVENTMTFIISHLKVAFEITGETSQRTEIFEYPLPAIRELILNAIVHRDYTSPTDIQIKIFDNKITVFNPGTLYGNLTIADLKTDDYQAQSRNKQIAEAFYLTKDIEKYGSGYRRIREQIAKYPTMYFEFAETSGGFLATLGYSQQKIFDTKDVTKDVTKENRRKFIVELIKSNAEITTDEIAEKLGLARRTILREMESLKKEHKIERIGGRKNGYWEIIK